MYNRYIGNTGKFYRVDDDELLQHDTRQSPQEQPTAFTPVQQPRPQHRQQNMQRLPFAQKELLGSIKGLLGNFLPDGMDLGDLLLILVLLLLYLEKEDEEILIILSVLIFMGFK